MDEVIYIPVAEICTRYNIDETLFNYLVSNELIIVVHEGQTQSIREEDITDLLTICRLHKELEINLDAMDVIINMRKRMLQLSKQVSSLQAKIDRLENERHYHLYDVASQQGLIIEISSE